MKEKWSAEAANEWYLKQGWIVGWNYVPAYAVNSTEMWQSDTFDPEAIKKELAFGAENGFNSIRIWLPFIVWNHEREKFMENFETLATIADSNGLSLMPMFFDDCRFDDTDPFLGKQPEPKFGVHNSRWTPSPGYAVTDDPEWQDRLEEYVKTVITRYKDDKRILVWDLYNEPARGGKSQPLVRNSFRWARECDPCQPLTTGVHAWTVDLPAFDLSDIISFHSYTDLEQTKKEVARLEKYNPENRPVFITEWLHRPAGNCVETHMPYFKENRISCYGWCLQGKTQTHLNWNTMGGTPDPNPAVWQHDMFRSDFTPYDEEEVKFFREITKDKRF